MLISLKVPPRRLTRDVASMGRVREASAFVDAVVVPESENLGGTGIVASFHLVN